MSGTIDPQTECNGPHPSRTQLWNFMTGQMRGPDFESVAEHMLLCPQCSELADSLPIEQDTFVAGMQEVFDPTEVGCPEEKLILPGGATAPVSERYTVLRSHASGGLGEVWLAHDRDLDRQVALKQLRIERASDPISRQRFLREVEITGKLEHPGIVPVYSLGRHSNGEPFYAMRFIQGQTLTQAIRDFHRVESDAKNSRAKRLVERKLLHHFVDVCQTVAYAHSRGVIHRDLKPSNIMLGPFGETLVVDWGLAKVIQSETAKAHSGENATVSTIDIRSALTDTREGKMVGTLPYCSPEQCQGQHNHEQPSSDIYSLGATLYELLVGRPPFSSSDQVEMTRQITQGDFARPRQIRRGIPMGLEAICLKAMAIDPNHRYRSATRMASDIESWLADEPVSAWPEPVTTRIARSMRRRVTWVAATIVTLVILAAILPWVVQLQRREQLSRSQLSEIAAEAANHRGELDEVVQRLDAALDTGHVEPIRIKLERIKSLIALHRTAPAWEGIHTLELRTDLGNSQSQVVLWHGDLLLMQSRLDEGLPKIEQAIELGLPAADESYARAMLSQNSSEAIRHFEVTLKIDPYHRQALEQLALLLIWSGKRDEARSRLEVIRQISPHLPCIPVFSAWLVALEGNGESYEPMIAAARDQLGEPAANKLERMCTNFVRMRESLPRWITTDDGIVERAHEELLRDLLNSELSSGTDAADGGRLFRTPPVLIRAYTPLIALYSEIATGFDGNKYAKELERSSSVHAEGSIQLMKALLLSGSVATDALSRQEFEQARNIFANAEQAAVKAAREPSLMSGMEQLSWYIATMAAKGQAVCLNSQGKDWTQEIQRAVRYAKSHNALGPMQFATEANYFYYIAKEANDEEFVREIVLEQLAIRPEAERVTWKEKLSRQYLRSGDFWNAYQVANELLKAQPNEEQLIETRKAAWEGMHRFLAEHAAAMK